MDPNTLTPEDKAELDRVIGISVPAMTAHDRAILRARRDYLTDAQKEDFKEVLESQEDVVVEEETNTPAEEVKAEPEIYVAKKDR